MKDRLFEFSTSARPATLSSLTASRCPLLAASSRGVKDVSVRASTLAPPSINCPYFRY